MERKKTIRAGKLKIAVILALVPFLTFWHWFDSASKKNHEGIVAYQSKNYDEALKQFLSAKGVKPNMGELKSNTASALYQMKKYKEALEEFSKIDPAKSGIQKSDFYYNLGNSFYRTYQPGNANQPGDLSPLEKALANYKKSLIANPSDLNAKKNFELTQKKLEEEQKKQNQDKNKDNKDNKDKKDDKKDNKDNKDKNKKDDKKKEEEKKQQEEKKKEEQKQQEQQQQQQQQNKEQKYKDIMQYLNQNEKNQLKNKKRLMIGVVKKEKDW